MKSSITYHLKDMANVKVFADRQTNKWTDRQVKNHMPLIFRYGSIKNDSCHSSKGIIQSKVSQGKRNANLICNYPRKATYEISVKHLHPMQGKLPKTRNRQTDR
jgi:hypothetical protein